MYIIQTLNSVKGVDRKVTLPTLFSSHAVPFPGDNKYIPFPMHITRNSLFNETTHALL